MAYNLETTDVKKLQTHIDNRWPLADDDEKVDLFDLAEGLYWYCHDYHTGQSSDEYNVLSTLEFSPSPLATGVEEGSGAHAVYLQLVEANHPYEPPPHYRIYKEATAWQ